MHLVIGAVTLESVAVGIEFEYEASESSMMEHLLTDHSYRRKIAELPDAQIRRLRRMLHDAVKQRIAPQKVYDAITRGFEEDSSPSLAYDLNEVARAKEEALLAIVRELEITV